MWSNFLSIAVNSKATMGFSRAYDKEEHDKRRGQKFVSSHLKSFYVDLFRSIKEEDLKDIN